ncbi:MAG: response regulator [Candidatus Rokubacteria bacterium]|nr:response regulator [Candidatus Rokubacteria bacterium]
MEDPRILVVDDESEVLDVMVDVLKQEGYAPQATTDSREASRLLESTAFDVIISDIMMPHLNGLQLLELAKQQNPNVQVVLVTGYSTREVALEALSRGATGYIEKPFHTDQLLASVREAIWRWRVKRDPKSLG